MKFTVLIVTYHPDWKKLLVTLDSVMAQPFKDYEIVVSDDGSEENCFDKIENGHIAKPIQVDKLLSIISEIIRQQD